MNITLRRSLASNSSEYLHIIEREEQHTHSVADKQTATELENKHDLHETAEESERNF